MTKQRNCPICDSELKIASTVKLRESGDIHIVGYHMFCKNIKCVYERDIKGGERGVQRKFAY